MALLGGALAQVSTWRITSTTAAKQARARAKRKYTCTVVGTARRHRLTPSSSTQLSGSRYFRQVIITWSMRSRGSVQRTHIITKTRNQHLKMKMTTFRMLPTTHKKLHS